MKWIALLTCAALLGASGCALRGSLQQEAVIREAARAMSKTYHFQDVSFVMMYIPAGEFLMGSLHNESEGDPDETPQHMVRVSAYWLGQTEVTQALWRAVMGHNPSYFQGDNDRPVEMVSWLDCQAFLQKLSQIIPGGKFRLPTEAEWEYACRAGSAHEWIVHGEKRHFDEFAWHAGNGKGQTHAVARKKPNARGLHDMQGNVWEWCADAYGSEFYGQSPVDNPVNNAGIYRIVRGGSWDYEPFALRCAYRGWFAPDARLGPHDVVGLRLAHDADGSDESIAH